MLKFVIIGFFAISIFILASINGRRKMRYYFMRNCTGFRWRRRFPEASKTEIRDFLDVFLDAFAFRQKWRLHFAPEDQVMEVYRTLYPPGSGITDAMELESLVKNFQSRYGMDIVSLWRPDITLGDLFALTKKLKSTG
jgi:propanediol dehydratase small subunit